MITTRLEPYKTLHSKPINTAADLTELNILHGIPSSLPISQSYAA